MTYCDLRNSGYDYIGSLFTGVTAYSDDVRILSCSCYILQKLLDLFCIWPKTGH